MSKSDDNGHDSTQHRSFWGLMKNEFSSKGSNFETIEITDKDGRTYKTTPYHLRQTAIADKLNPLSVMGKIAGVALACGFIKWLFSEKKGGDVLSSSSGDKISRRIFNGTWKTEKKS
jgi:CRISPR/Cas system Type II protein with McrA/HNH and RuvC-like nuclease domain